MNISPSLKPCQAVFSGSSIYRLANHRLTSGVDIKQIRRANVLALIGKGTRVAFATKVGTDPAYISQILSTKTKADVGNELARAIETAYKLPYGWMDHEHQGGNEQIIADFAWTYNNVNDKGKDLLLKMIDAAKSGYLEDRKERSKKA